MGALLSTQHFILEEHLDVISVSELMDHDECMELERDDLIDVMLKMHQANSSRKWRLMMRNAIMIKSDLSLSTYTQYVDDFKFWLRTAGDRHKLPPKEIVKIFVVLSQRYSKMRYTRVRVKL
jgi:hypothetical protein